MAETRREIAKFFRQGESMRTILSSAVTAAVLVVTAGPAAAQFKPTAESLSGLYAGKVYSPYAQRRFPSRPLWGDTHLHTGLSVDAGLFGARLGLDEAYRFARGEEVTASSGQPAKLSRPLDWLVIADHSDAMGFFTDLAAGRPEILKYAQAKPWYDGLQAGGGVYESGVGPYHNLRTGKDRSGDARRVFAGRPDLQVDLGEGRRRGRAL